MKQNLLIIKTGIARKEYFATSRDKEINGSYDFNTPSSMYIHFIARPPLYPPVLIFIAPAASS